MGVDKASIRFGEATLLERALARLGEACDPVLIAPGEVDVVTAGHRAVMDALPGAGPLGGIVAALRASPHRLLAVVAVDLPWMDPRLMRLLADRIGDHDAAVCETESGLQPLHAVYAASVLAAAETALAGPDRSLRHLLAQTRTVRIAERDWRAAGVADAFARNVNTPEDLAALSLELPQSASAPLSPLARARRSPRRRR